MVDQKKEAREQPLSERAFKRWKQTSKNVAVIFNEYPDKSFTAEQIYDIIRTWHLNTEGSKYSESAIRAVLSRFTKKGYLKVLKTEDKRAKKRYMATAKGQEVFAFFSKCVDYGSSHTEGALGQVPRTQIVEPEIGKTRERRYEIAFHSWNEIVAFNEGWPENRVLPTVRLPPFIIQQLRLMATRNQGTSAGWVWVYGKEFKIRIAKKQALQLYINKLGWKEELREWLTTVPNLKDEHLDIIWNKIAEVCKHQVVTYESHVPDSKIAAVRPDCFRESGPQRWIDTDHHGVRILTSSTPGTGGPCQGRGGVCRPGSPESCSSVRDSWTLREQVLQEAGGAHKEDHEPSQEHHGHDPEGAPDVEIHCLQDPRGERRPEGTRLTAGEYSVKIAAEAGGVS